MRDLTQAWVDAMRHGDFEAAWRISDRLIADRPVGATCVDRPRHEQWVWNGTPLANRRVLVRCYHGLGDTLQFARWLPRLAQIAREVVVWAQPWLIPLLETMALPSSVRFAALHDGDPGHDYDVDIEIMELAHAFRISEQDLPGVELPYLHVRSAARLSRQLCVGVLAQSGEWDPLRSVPPADMVLATPGVDFFDLRLDAAPLPGMRRATEGQALALAARLRSLDLVISVDTMMAHLAGALGVATWLLLPRVADWRWLCERADSPWYPTLRLFRQPAAGRWDLVLKRVRQELEGWSACAR